MEKLGDAAVAGVVPGHRDKYALVERERRFLLARPPRGGAARRDITDHYLTGTRLRLRRVAGGGRTGGGRTGGGCAEPEYKLTQKVPAPRPGPVCGLITNLYLSRAEYDVLRALPAAELSKTRLSFPPYVVDVFAAPRHGLVLAEVELGTDAELAACPPPPGAVAEVTSDDRFTGGRLAVARRAELLAWLAEYGVHADARPLAEVRWRGGAVARRCGAMRCGEVRRDAARRGDVAQPPHPHHTPLSPFLCQRAGAPSCRG